MRVPYAIGFVGTGRYRTDAIELTLIAYYYYIFSQRTTLIKDVSMKQ